MANKITIATTDVQMRLFMARFSSLFSSVESGGRLDFDPEEDLSFPEVPSRLSPRLPSL
jgi:hypothetical protein